VTVVDFPGYGHAIASKAEKSLWTQMIDTYLQERPILTRCCVLVDSTRGICGGDKKFLKTLNRHGVAWTVVATKGDLLGADLLQRSLSLMRGDLLPLFDWSPMSKLSNALEERERLVWPVSTATGAGVNELWREVVRWVDASALPITGPACTSTVIS
jgi:GTP-binding protein EngB required for normal cell division